MITNKQRLELLHAPKPYEPLQDINAWAKLLREQGTPLGWGIIISLLSRARIKTGKYGHTR